MNFIKNMKISRAIMFVAFVPALVAVLFAGQVVLQEVKTVRSLEQLSTLTALSVTMSNLVHEQQKERGATAGFLGSHGTKFVEALPNQRKDTDEKREVLEAYLKGFDASQFDATFNKKFNAILSDLAKIDDIRRSVDSLSIPTAKAIAYYSGLNAKNISLIGYMGHLSKNAGITVSLVAYTNFLNGKELAGVERAVGAGGFSAGQFSAKAGNKFKLLANTQSIYNGVFLSYATANQISKFNEVMNTFEAKEVERMRNIANESAISGDLQGVQGKYWFDTITKKINGLKSMEDKIAGDLSTQMAAANSSAKSKMTLALAIALVSIAVVLALSVLIIRSINASFSGVVDSMTHLAEGDLEAELPEETANEIGEMVRALVVFKANGIEARKLTAAQEAENQEKIKRGERIEEMVNLFDAKVSELLEGLSAAATEMEATSQSMSSLAEETNQQSASVSQAATQAGENVQNVASATEELTSSIQEIAQQINKSGENTQIASKSVSESQATVSRLSEAAGKIGEAIGLITDIAEQTNLLALNATIEAARAGDAGKGFAVVASEVKNLAAQTSEVTEEIRGMIETIQKETNHAVTATEDVSRIIEDLSAASTAVAAAMEEQTSATQDISRNVQEAASGTGEVTDNIANVSSAAEESGKAATEVLEVARQLAERSQSMKSEVETFLTDIRAA